MCIHLSQINGGKMLNNTEYHALNNLICLEQLDIIDDNENEFWNTIRRKIEPPKYEEPTYEEIELNSIL